MPETQLRCWQPRRPSAGLKRRIFSANPCRSAATWFAGSLAPVAACALLTLLVFDSGTALPGSSTGHGAVIAMILSNQNYAAYASEGSQNEQNRLPVVTFDSTNRSVSASSMCSAPFTKPNN